MFHGVNCSLLRLHSTTVHKSILMNVLRNCFIVVQSQFTSGHANLRMLSPNEWRLTLVLLVFLWGSTSDTFPCTSLEIASTSPVWSLVHSSKSPGSSIRPIPENGHSPEIFRSFNFAQNILSAYPHLLVTCKCLHFGHATPVSVGNSIPTSWHSQGSEEKKKNVLFYAHPLLWTPVFLPFVCYKWSAPTPATTYNINSKLHGQKMSEIPLSQTNENRQKSRPGQSMRE